MYHVFKSVSTITFGHFVDISDVNAENNISNGSNVNAGIGDSILAGLPSF